jgi:UDP-GlcNAc:undecaprenyl-phosphate GlcNAc-1-phosphate transferase
MVPTIIFFGSLAASLLLTPYLISVLQSAGVVDRPGGRKIHSNIVPRMGGALLGITGILVLIFFSNPNTQIVFLLLSFLILFTCGIIDDIYKLNCWIKFLLQNLASLSLILYLSPLISNIYLLGLEFDSVFGFLVLHFFIVGTVNAVNLLDGLDGLLGGISLIIFSIILAISIISYNFILIVLSLCLIGGLLGFLRYNSFPASIFLGDTGSLSLGFFLVVSSILVSLNLTPSHLDLTIPLLLLALPIIDCLKVFVMRIYRKRSPFTPDNLHIHYVLTLNGINQKFTVFFLELVTIAFVLLLLLYIKGSQFWSLLFFSMVSLLLIFAQPIIIKLKSARNYFKYLKPAFEKTESSYPAFRKNFIILLGVILILKLITSFPVTSVFDKIEILYLLLIGALARSSSGLGRRPLKAEITGSNPVRATRKGNSSLFYSCCIPGTSLVWQCY